MPAQRVPVAFLVAWVFGAFHSALAADRSDAEYSVRFESTWSDQTHPIDFPSNPHFSGLIGGTHNDAVSFWELGELASPGIQSMAETGSKTLLQGEIQNAIGAGTAAAVISGGGIPVSPGVVTESFTITESHPLVTLVSMLAPSPDWFVGVKGLNLRENGEWVPVKVVDLLVHDAGTDSGSSYGSPNQPTVPHIPIYIKTEVPFAESNLVGTFTFELTPTDAPGETSLGSLRIRTLGPNPARGAVRFEVRASGKSPANLSLHDAQGRLVRTLLSGERVELREIPWNGRDHKGDPAATGVYIATLREGSQSRSAKLVFLR